MMRKACLALAALLFVNSIPASAGMMDAMADFKKPNMKIGQLALHPYYGLSLTYDDNIYKVHANRGAFPVNAGNDGVVGSWLMTNNVGIGFDLPLNEMHKVSALYDFRSDIYRKKSSANNAISQMVNVAYNFKGARSRANVYNNYINTQDPAFNTNKSVLSGELTKRERRWNDTMGLSAEYFLGDKFFVGADASNDITKYLSRGLGAALNNSSLLFGVKGGYKIQPKTRVFTAIHRGITHYSAGRAANHKDWMLDFGIDGELTAKLKGLVQTGVSYRRYDEDTSNPSFNPTNAGNPGPLRASNFHFTRITRNWTSQVGLTYKATDRCRTTLTANRGVNDTSSNASGGQFFVSTGAGLDLEHDFNKLTLGANGGVQYDKYAEAITLAGSTANRRDDTYQAGVKADYKIQEWLLTGLAYKHTRRFSRFSDQFSYKNSQTSWNLKVVF